MVTRHRQRIVVLIAASLGAVAVAAAPAHAAQHSTSPTIHAQATGGGAPVASRKVIASATFHASRTSGAGVRPAAGPPTINCEVFTDPPEQVPAGQSFGGQTKPYNAVAAVTFTSCTSVVARISMTPALSYNGGSTTFGPAVTTLEDSGATAGVMSFCAPGDWQPAASATIIAPPNYQPPQETITGLGGIWNFTEFDCNPGLR